MLHGCADQGTPPPPPPAVPVIDRIEPDTLRSGEQVRIHGSGFETFQPGYVVVFPENIPATIYVGWSDEMITTYVPQGVVQGEVRVRKSSLESNAVAIHIAAQIGGPFTLSATTLSFSQGQNRNVSINGGQPPYTMQSGPSQSIATATISGATLSISGIGAGNTAIIVSDATLPSPQTATLTIDVTAAQSGVSFSQQVLPIFTASCAGCHGGSANLFLTQSQAYSNLVNVAAQTGTCAGSPRVLPGNSAQSALYRRISGTCSDRMPLGGSLTPAEIEIIRQWIDQGALNN